MIEAPLLQEVREEARAEGKAEGKAELLVEVLGERFGPLPADIVRAIHAAPHQRGLAVTLLACDDLEAVRRALWR